jgi:hypothetical protein
MKTRLLYFTSLIMALSSILYITPTYSSSDCGSTPWESRNGRSCASIGLNSKQAVCRAGNKYAMFCDDTSSKIRICPSNQLCNQNSSANTGAECPRKTQKADKPVRACNTYKSGYKHGSRDALKGRNNDYRRWEDKYLKATRKHFEDGYRIGYRDNE